MIKKLAPKIKMNNGYEIPLIGFGTYKMPDSNETKNMVKHAINWGYRHIDTAWYYQNHKSVGEAIKESGIPRNELFITSKLWNSHQGYESAKKMLNECLEEMQLEYLDLYLIHWPIAKDHEHDHYELINQTWKAFEEMYHEGKIKAIGVSNFEVDHLKNLIANNKIIPMVNQIEFHPGLLNQEVIDFCQKHNILVESWSPLLRGKVFESKLLQELSLKYKKSIAQICLRWCIQKGTIPLPKSSNQNRIIENFNIFDFELSNEDVKRIDVDETFSRIGPNPNNAI